MSVKEQKNMSLFMSVTTSPNHSQVSLKNELDDGRRGTELLFLDLNTVAAATDSFSFHNKLGEGGFGSVYKVLTSPFYNISYAVLDYISVYINSLTHFCILYVHIKN